MRRIVMTLVVTALFASMVFAQMPGQGPRLGGLWNPQVGSGAVYEMVERDGGKQQMEIAIVGEETHQGKRGYWMEVTMGDPEGEDGPMVMKTLVVVTGKELEPVKMASRTGLMTVLRVLTDAKTKIRGTPRMFNPADMMRNPG